MRPTLTSMLPKRIGIAIAPDGMWAAAGGHHAMGMRRPGPGEIRERPLEPLGPGSTWPDLEDALRDLREDIAPEGGHLAVALLPPLVRLRRLDLPPLTDAETRGVIERGATKYFTGVREAQVAGISRVMHRLRRSGSVVAAVAPARVVTAVLDAARAAGWSVAAVRPAHAAWIAGARAQWPELGSELAQLAILRNESTELLRLERGAIGGVRQFGGVSTRTDQVVDAVIDSAADNAPLPLLTIGPEDRRQLLAAALGERGIQLGDRAARWRAVSESPEAMAAAFAHDAAALDLLPPQAHAMRDATARRSALGLAAAAAFFLVVGAAAQLWDVRREVASIQARRAEIRGAVDGASEARATIESLRRRLIALQPLEQNATRWSAVLAEVASYLPRDAYLVDVRAAADSMVLEGVASRAAGVFDRLARAPGIAAVKPAGSIRRDVTDAGATVERFSLAARIGRDSAVAKDPR